MTETQKMDQLWVKLVVLIPLLTLSTILILSSMGNSYVQFTDTEFVIMILCFLVMVGVSYLIFKTELRTKIDQEGVHVQFVPFINKTKIFRWNEIEKIEVCEYNPIKDFGGWGLRYSLRGKGKAYNIKGNKGIQLEFKEGKKLLIGTQKPEKAEAVLRNLGKWSE